ncbi:hypothetical protein H696_03866 [Fonticula alba]|uniref:N-acetyltransferase domain-containing protein n=1 Tax=Fonticula alba TaxID=691883 RepID=A0A058Z7E5_FONAL|nr:hypothetical protein H696_03866 [Fonticula alba]KCV69437.1 hypothetical protein H696_03866 [Fonticula alba]|eukprot:XP_009496002.1 hypothetical protein H696_03866 [Fonticula alba]
MSSRSPVSIDKVYPNNLGQFRQIHSSSLPVVYSDTFFQKAIETTGSVFSRIAYYNDAAVGCIFGRDVTPAGSSTFAVEILTLCVLPAYRRSGVASELVSSLIAWTRGHLSREAASDDSPFTSARVFLHVQTSNSGARAFYAAQGFTPAPLPEGAAPFPGEAGLVVSGYYKGRVTPDDAAVLERLL